MIGYDFNPEITTITLDNPERHNALSHEDFATLHKLLDHIETEMPRVVIITGNGPSFCSGVEFTSLQTGDWANDNPLNKLCNRVEALPMSVIAALNGHFIGGGAELAFAADFRIAIPTAKCKIPAAAIGVHYEPSGIARVVGVVGDQIARRLFLSLDTFAGHELLAHHFIDAFDNDPLEAARAQAERIAKLAPLALMGMKQSLRAIRHGKPESNVRARITHAFASNDFAEAMEAVTQKRTPRFNGD